MDLKELEKHWDALGKTDPLWAVLTDPNKRGGKWDPDEFFLAGQREISAVLNHIGARGYTLRKGRALDFGCGVGRVTQALCNHFQECVGVDIAPSMIRLAEKYNRHGHKCRYHLNPSLNLELFRDATFDFVYSGLVLQHIEPSYSKTYMQEFFRVLAPGGCAVFQVPSGPRIPFERIPDSAFRAQISVPQATFKTRLGSAMTLVARVQNSSPNRWPAHTAEEGGGVFNLGNHWRDASGSLLALDDGRVMLPKSLESQEEIQLELTVNAPSAPGDYILELDMVLEGVCWFKDKGSTTTRLVVEVEDSKSTAQSQANESASEACEHATFVPRMEMYGVPKEEILSLISASGCDVLDTRDDFSAGPGWVGYRYFVTKPDPTLAAQGVAALRNRIETLQEKMETLLRQKGEAEREYARSLAAHAEVIGQLEERVAMLEGQCAVQKAELEWLYRWIPVNKLARRFLLGRNLHKRLMARLHLRP
jgi:SAM-dependent methyltransferase